MATSETLQIRRGKQVSWIDPAAYNGLYRNAGWDSEELLTAPPSAARFPFRHAIPLHLVRFLPGTITAWCNENAKDSWHYSNEVFRLWIAFQEQGDSDLFDLTWMRLDPKDLL